MKYLLVIFLSFFIYSLSADPDRLEKKIIEKAHCP